MDQTELPFRVRLFEDQTGAGSRDASYAEAVRVDHHNCRLGKWYESQGRELFGSLPSYKALFQPHAQVHASVHAMLPYLSQGWEKNLGIQQAMFAQLQSAEAGMAAAQIRLRAFGVAADSIDARSGTAPIRWRGSAITRANTPRR